MTSQTPNPLREYRTAKKWTLDQMAQHIGVKRNTVWRWENDPDRTPARSMWQTIKDKTGIEFELSIRVGEEP